MFFYGGLGIAYAVMVPIVYFYRHHKSNGKCMRSPETDAAVTAAMIWPVTLTIDWFYGI